IGLGQWVWGEFAGPSLSFVLDTKQSARELMLRGHYDEAINKFHGEWETTAILIGAARKLGSLEGDPLLRQRVDGWVRKAVEAVAVLLTAERQNDKAMIPAAKQDLENVWKDPVAEEVRTLLRGAGARKRRPETTYYLALCKHELAELVQGRSRPEVKAPEWDGALFWWKQYTGEYSREPEGWAARRQQGLALMARGRRDEAIEVWGEGELDDKWPLQKFEKVACLYLAEQARQQK